MIILVGVGHVFDIADQVRRLIQEERPDVVGVELDPPRYQALLNPPRDRSGVPLAYRLLAAFQRRLAKSYGGEVGAEMLAATEAAKEAGAEVLLIDADAAQVFRRLWREMPPRERLKLGLSAFTSLFLSQGRVEKELESFQAHEETYIQEMSKQFPTVKRLLIDERNQVMARRINAAASRYPTVLAVVGDGHIEGIVRLLDRDDIRVVRLRELMGHGPPPSDGKGNAQVRFHYEVLLR